MARSSRFSGRSGSGKSTLLRVVAGLQRPSAGRVLLDGAGPRLGPSHRRGIGLVFQDHALFHHRDVAGNVAFGLRMRGDAAEQIEPRVRRLLDLVGLPGFEQRSVATLSGGEQQRVALARALAPEPRVLLLDEPLGSLDRRLRDRLLIDLERLFDGDTPDGALRDARSGRGVRARRSRRRHARRSHRPDGTPDELWAQPGGRGHRALPRARDVRDRTAVRPEAVSVRAAGLGERGDGIVESAVRHGPTVRLLIRLEQRASRLTAAVTALDHPADRGARHRRHRPGRSRRAQVIRRRVDRPRLRPGRVLPRHRATARG